MDQFTMLVNYFCQSDVEKQQSCCMETTDSLEFVENSLLMQYNITDVRNYSARNK